VVIGDGLKYRDLDAGCRCRVDDDQLVRVSADGGLGASGHDISDDAFGLAGRCACRYSQPPPLAAVCPILDADNRHGAERANVHGLDDRPAVAWADLGFRDRLRLHLASMGCDDPGTRREK